MPPTLTYDDGSGALSVQRRAMVLDANVLIAAFSPDEGRQHSDSLGFIENPSEFEVDQWIVPVVVVIEAWGLLHSRSKRVEKGPGKHEAGLRMLSWLQDPGNPVLIVRFAPGAMEDSSAHTIERIVLEHHVDVVDAVLVVTADRVSVNCGLQPPIRVATYDCRDLPRLRRGLNARLRVFDMNTLELND